MSTTTTADLDRQLNETILKGDILGAFDKFYADDVVMQENLAEPTPGKAANRKREEDFLSSVEAFHSAALLSSAVNWRRDLWGVGGGCDLQGRRAV
jgi:hypothetical protein